MKPIGATPIDGETLCGAFAYPEGYTSEMTGAAAQRPEHPEHPRPFDSRRIVCPKCGELIRRLTAERGSFYLTCSNRIPTPESKPGAPPLERRTTHCGQTVHIVAIDGVAFVTAISKAQFAKFQRIYNTAQVYAELGVIHSRPSSPEEIPRYRCRGCGTLTPLHDLYGGLCRASCAPGTVDAGA